MRRKKLFIALLVFVSLSPSSYANKLFWDYADWMGDVKSQNSDFQYASLFEIAIPGARYADTHTVNPSDLAKEYCDLRFYDFFNSCKRKFLNKYEQKAYQNYSIEDQLNHGVRYFQFAYNNEIAYEAMLESFKMITTFLQKHTKEIVILDIPAYSSLSAFETFQYLINHALGSLLISKSKNSNLILEELWKTDQRVLLLYPNDLFLQRSVQDVIWSKQANAYFYNKVEKLPTSNLRDHFHILNADDPYQIAIWAGDANYEKRINIAASNFVLESDLVDILVQKNLKTRIKYPQGIYLYEHANYEGRYIYLRKGEIPKLKSHPLFSLFNNHIRSVRIVGDFEVTLCEFENFSGQYIRISQDTPNLMSFNELISSVQASPYN